MQRITFIPVKLYGDFVKDSCNRINFEFRKYELYSGNEIAEQAFLSSLDIPEKDIAVLCGYFKNGIIKAACECDSVSNFKSILPKDCEKYAKNIYTKAKYIINDYELLEFILQYGGNYNNFLKLKRNVKNPLTAIKNNPYKFGINAGLKFRTCELMAKANDISSLDKRRVDGILMYAMNNIISNGDLYATADELRLQVNELAKEDSVPFAYILSLAINDEKYSVVNNKIYLSRLRTIQTRFVNNVQRLETSGKDHAFDENVLNSILSKNQIELSESQREAVKAACHEGISIIKGGPGSGKTTLTNIIIQYCEEKYKGKGICLCAPTGCAAQNLALKTNRCALTIHKTLGLKPYSGTELQITKKLTDYIYIVDEMSMTDIELAEMLFSAIPNGSVIILIGDIEQLPSVNAGSVLEDLIDAGICTHSLKGCFRQADDSTIIKNAYKIKSGEIKLSSSKNFDIMYLNNEHDIEEMCVSYIPESNEDISKLQILCPVKKGICGTRNINNKVQSKRNLPTVYSKHYGSTSFRIGDEVITVYNNYEIGYFNGETGRITDIDEDGIAVTFSEEKELYIPNAYLCDVSLAYAITIHKSQGSECENIIILLTNASKSILTKNLLYTAITRAKKSVTIMTTHGLLEYAIKNSPRKRNSEVAYILQNKL